MSITYISLSYFVEVFRTHCVTCPLQDSNKIVCGCAAARADMWWEVKQSVLGFNTHYCLSTFSHGLQNLKFMKVRCSRWLFHFIGFLKNGRQRT